MTGGNNGFILRTAAPGDAEDAAACWVAAFGDAPDFVREIISGAGLLENAAAAEADGHVRSLMFAFDGVKFAGFPTSYMYALCTAPEYRGQGMGAAVCLRLARQCFDRGAELVFLSPADSGLEEWYRRRMGMKVLSRFADLPAVCSDSECASCERIGPEEYALLRAAASDLTVTAKLLSAQKILFCHYGGALLRVVLDGRIIPACAELYRGAVLVRELLCDRADTARALGAVSAFFGGREVLLRQRAGCGGALLYLTRDGQTFPPCQQFPYFPFTLD